MEIKDKNIELAYGQVEKKVIFSKPYVDFIIKNVIDNKIFESKIREYFLEEKGVFQGDKFYEFIQDIKYMEMLSHALGIEDEFYTATMNGVKDNNLIDTVINTKLLETMYGNPKKDDFTSNDVVFSILETVFGLDTLMISLTNKKVLTDKLNYVLNNCSEFNFRKVENYEDDIKDFYVELQKLYVDTSNMTNYDDIKAYIKNNCDGLIPFIQAGLSNHIRNVIKDEIGSYKKYDSLASEILDLFAKNRVI